jgi:hypothetical protein
MFLHEFNHVYYHINSLDRSSRIDFILDDLKNNPKKIKLFDNFKEHNKNASYTNALLKSNNNKHL